MTQVAILTPDPEDPSHGGRWGAVFDRLAAPLTDAGFTVTPTPWTEHERTATGLSGHDLVLPVLVWGYHRTHERWLAACDVWERAGVPLFNPPAVLRWNSDKRYLGRLRDAGAPVIPTLYQDDVQPGHVEAAFDALKADTLVLKPAVSGGAYRTQRLVRGDLELWNPVQAPLGTAMIQPYQPRIESEGELSLLFFGGDFSHAVRKVPAGGDFRSQPDYGGALSEETPSDDALAAAHAVLALIDEDLLYARIDLAPGEDGWLLIEAELIEPDFYLGFDPARGRGFARAVRERAGR